MNSFFKFVLGAEVFLVAACTTSVQEDTSTTEDFKAQEVVDKAINVHGGDRYDHALIEFDFRGRHYISSRNGGLFQYERIFSDTTGGSPQMVRDVLSNQTFKRYIGGQEVEVSEKMKRAYSNSVNSVLYFVQLPYFLNDPAVKKKYLGETSVEGQAYHKVEVTFEKEGGGKDYQDIFVYWFHKERYTMDYFGYSYETDGGGVRFRKAYHVQTIQGIRFANFINYQAEYPKYSVYDLDSLHDEGQLEELSRIENTNLQVTLLEENQPG